jgi:hypothetical protein
MTSAIHNLPDESTFGLEFNYSQWTAGTVVTLCNVPWSNDYRDVVYFDTTSLLDDYLANNAGPRVVIDRMTLISPGMPVKVNVPFAKALNYNYLRVRNPVNPVNDIAFSYYYFITNARYVAPNTTEFTVQLDVWSTFIHKAEFGQCYVERGHIGIANENQMELNGRIHLTVPEGLDIGNEYINASRYMSVLATTADQLTDVPYAVLVSSIVDFTASDFGTIDNPMLSTAKGSFVEGLPNAYQMLYFPDVNDFKAFLNTFADKPWMTQGIVNVTAIPPLNVLLPDIAIEEINGLLVLNGAFDSDVLKHDITLGVNWRDSVLPARYAHLKKFLTYPYTFVELTTYSGTPIVLKPECMSGVNIDVSQMTHITQPSPRMLFYPRNYNVSGNTTHPSDGEYLNLATGLYNLPTFAVLNNGFLSYMAANAHRLAFSYDSANWSQQKAMMGAGTAQAQADEAINAMNEQTKITQNQIHDSTMTNIAGNVGNTLISGVAGIQQGMTSGGISGASSGGGKGAATGAVVGAVSGLQSFGENLLHLGTNTAVGMVQANIASSAAGARNRVATGLAGYVRDSNYGLAQSVAKGDYANEIAGINARVQDARLIQPTVSGQIGGDAMLLGLDQWAIYAKVKTVGPNVLRTVGEFWLRYGYAINRFVIPPSNFKCMTKFTYWKMKETYLRSTYIPEGYKQALRGILEKGVTVWSDPDFIGFTDVADNNPLNGIVLT